MTSANNRGWLTTAAGVSMPWLIYGTAWKKERTDELVLAAVSSGFRGIDTACQPRHYREDLVGKALNDLQGNGVSRHELYLQTKYTPVSGQDMATIPYDPHSPVRQQVSQSFAASLANLATDHLDTFILHSPLTTLEQTLEAWQAMEEVQQSGGARQLGLSNCYSLQLLIALFETATVKPAVLQNRFYSETGYDGEIRQWCNDNKVIYQSFWSLTANRHIVKSTTFQQLASSHKRSTEQIMFRYLHQLGIVPLTGTNSVTHMKDDLAVLDFALSKEEMAQVSALLR